MGRREEEPAASRRHERQKASPSPARGEEDEEAIRNKLRESGWKKRHADGDRAVDAEPLHDREKMHDKTEKSSPRAPDDRRSARPSRRSRSPRRRDREHRSSRRKSSASRRRSPSRSRTPASRSPSRSRSAGRRRRRHVSSSKKRRSSRSRSRDVKRSKRASSRSRSASKRKTEETKEEKKEKKETKEDDDETETENEDGEKEKQEKDKKDERHKLSSSARKTSRRSRSGSPSSPSRSSRRRRHRRNASHSRSPSRGRRNRRGGSRSRSRSLTRDRRSRGRDRRSRRRYSRSRSPSYNSRRRRRTDRSSSRDRPRRDSSPEPHQHPPVATDAAATTTTAPVSSTGVAPPPPAGVNPTITQLMAQYPTMSLQDIIAKMQASNVTMAAAVAQKPARELYVGNLPPNVTGPQLQEFLSTIIQQVGLTTQPGNPIVNTWISTDGHFAFCEMRSVEECNLALLLNQLPLLGQPLKFGRPRSFMGPPQPMPQILARTQTALVNLGCTPNPAWFAQTDVSSMSVDLLAPLADASTLTGSTVVQSTLASSFGDASSPHRLIMSNIPIVLTEDQVKELVEPFGALKNFTLVKDPATGASMGSALFQYEDDAVATQAVEGLNGLSIGGILLSVQRQPPGVTVPGSVSNHDDQPSPVVKMANMISVDELRDDEEYADLAEDVEEECKRFGEVTGMEIPRPKDGEEVPGLGCIYVRFGKEEDAVSALKALNGRKFGGNIVKVTYFSLDKFEKRQFS